MRATRHILTKLLTGMTAVLLFATLAAAATVEIKMNNTVGNYLTDENGMTLYLFKKDTIGKSMCAGACVDKWPLFAVENITVPDGVNAADFATIIRDDGKKQTTYKGMPLYYFAKDAKAGDTTGHGVNNVWYIVAP